LFGLLCHQAEAYETVNVLLPQELNALFPNGIPHRPALFGIPSYAHSIPGPLLYATPGDRDGCDPLDEAVVATWPQNTSKLVMVDRGDCFFVTKVRNAQNAGASAVIVVDNVDEFFEPFMADDGTGADITIPSVLISKANGQTLKNYLNSGVVTLSMAWAMPTGGNVQIDLWTSSNDPHAREFRTVFGDVAAAMKEKTTFTPHYWILPGGTQCNWPANDGQGPCGNLCTDDGKYCATDPDQDLQSGLSGKDILEENLRQLCIWEQLQASNRQHVWWQYSKLFISNCCEPGDLFTTPCRATNWGAACSNSVMAPLGIDSNEVATCFNTRRNELFDREIAERHSSGIFTIPTLMINNSPYRGGLICNDPINAFTCGPLEAVCAGFESGQAPDACEGDISCQYGVFQDQCGVCGADGRIDACGLCLSPSSSHFDKSCLGCDGVVNSQKVADACGVCDGDGSFDVCGRCWGASDSRRVDEVGGDCSAGTGNNTMIWVIFGGTLLAIGGGVYAWNKRQQAHLARIDAVLQSYLPLSEANEVRTGGPAGEDAAQHMRLNTEEPSEI
jgi:hypothetical protein